MRGEVAIVGAGGAVGAAVAALARATPGLRVALAAERASAAEVAEALGGAGCAVLALPEGESRELGRALVARGVRVVDLGRDQRLLPHVPAAFGGGGAGAGKRLVALPSPAAMAAWLASAPLVAAGLLHPDRLALLVLAASGPGGGDGFEVARAEVAGELAWLFDQRGWPMERATCTVVHAPLGSSLLAVVQGDLAHEDGADPAALRRALERYLRGAAPASDEAASGDAAGDLVAAPDSVRLGAPGEQPDWARVAGAGVAEVAVAVDGFAERITATCALDAVAFVAREAVGAAMRLLQAAGGDEAT